MTELLYEVRRYFKPRGQTPPRCRSRRWLVSQFYPKGNRPIVGRGSYDVGVVHQWESCGYTHGKYDFQWSTQTQELSKYIRINTSKGRVETESVREINREIKGPLRNWSSWEGAEWGEMLSECRSVRAVVRGATKVDGIDNLLWLPPGLIAGR